MDSHHKFLSYSAGVFFALLSLGLVLQRFSPAPFWIDMRSTTRPETRMISVQGQGKVSAAPDIATLTVSVISEGKVVKTVKQENTEKMNRIIAGLKKLGLADKDIATASYDLYPDYSYEPNLPPRIRGFRLTQTLALKVRDLDKVDQVIDTATELGANNVGGLAFTLDNKDAVNDEAREKAFADAREKAQRMAKAAGVTLGKVVGFSESGGYYPPVPVYYEKAVMMSADAGRGGASPDIQPGSQDYQVSVDITYEID